MVGRGLRRLPRLITICVVVVVFHVMRCDAKTEVESEYIFFFIFLYERTDARVGGHLAGRLQEEV